MLCIVKLIGFQYVGSICYFITGGGEMRVTESVEGQWCGSVVRVSGEGQWCATVVRDSGVGKW